MNSPPSDAPYMAYARDVVSGAIPACLYVRQAAQRFLDDLSKGVWQFHPELVQKVASFCQKLPLTEGPLAPSKVKLMDWQWFMIANMYGFTDGDGTRRYRQATVYVPKGNSKSSTAGMLGLYHLCADGDNVPQVYSVAVKQEQAKIVWEAASRTVDASPALKAFYNLTTTNNNASCKIKRPDGSAFVPLSSERKGLHGKNISFCAIDEIASHPTRDVYDAMTSSTGKRRHPMILNISTATGYQEGIGKIVYDYGVSVLNGEIEDDRHFFLLYGMDEGDDPYDVNTWIKCNPSWWVAIDRVDFATNANQAKHSPSQEASFLTFRLNCWVQTDAALFSVTTMRANCAEDIRLEDFRGDDCYVGLDLAYRLDMCGLALIFPKWIDGKLNYYCFTKAYINQGILNKGWNLRYHGWVKSKLIDLTPGDVTDFDRIMDDLCDIHAKYHVKHVCIDKAHAGSVMHLAQRAGIEVLIIPNTPMVLTSPTKEFEAAYTEGRFHYSKQDEVLEWNVACVIGHHDDRGTVLPKKDKRKKSDKIDIFMAALMGITKAMEVEDNTTSVYETRGISTFG